MKVKKKSFDLEDEKKPICSWEGAILTELVQCWLDISHTVASLFAGELMKRVERDELKEHSRVQRGGIVSPV